MTRVPPADTTSGMIGLGNMGGRIARRIRDAGLPVRGLRPQRGAGRGVGDRRRRPRSPSSRPRSTSSSSRCPTAASSRRSSSATAGCSRAARAGQVVVDLSTAAPALDGADPRGAARARRRVRRRRHLGRRRRGRAGDAHDHGGRLEGGARRGDADPRDVQRARLPHGRLRLGARRQAAEQLPQRRSASPRPPR